MLISNQTDCPKLSQLTDEDVNTYYSHKSTPVMLAAKEAHKQMLKKQKSKWHELLMDRSDSEDTYDDLNDETVDQLSINIKNLNFNAITNNYYSSSSQSKVGETTSTIVKKSQFYSPDSHNKRSIVSKRQRNELKTNNLRKTVTRMMKSNPNQSHIWNIDLTEDNSKSVFS